MAWPEADEQPAFAVDREPEIVASCRGNSMALNPARRSARVTTTSYNQGASAAEDGLEVVEKLDQSDRVF